MELRTTRELRRNERLSKAMAKKAEADAPTPAQPAQKQPPADKHTLSRQALSFLEEQNRKRLELDLEREQRRQARMNNSLSQLESSKGHLDRLDKALKVLSKCQKIAASIMKGNRVPPEDLRYLMENDPEGYKLAMAMRRQNPDPEDEKSVLDEEDKNGGSTKRSGDSGEAPGVSAPEASSGSGASSSDGGETSASAE